MALADPYSCGSYGACVIIHHLPERHTQGPGVVRELKTSGKSGSTSHSVSFYALPQFFAIQTENADLQVSTNLGDVVAAYSKCPRLTTRKVKTLEAGGMWLVEAPLNEA